MVQRYPHAQQHIMEGGDHAISGFEQHLPVLMRFLELA